MSHLGTLGNTVTGINFKALRHLRWPTHLTKAGFTSSRSLCLSNPLLPSKLNFIDVSDLRTSTHAARVGAGFSLASELPKACFFRSLTHIQKACPGSFQRCIATTSGSSPATSAEGLVERPVRRGGSLADRPNLVAAEPPSLRLVEIDMEDVEKERRKAIKRNNFYGVRTHS